MNEIVITNYHHIDAITLMKLYEHHGLFNVVAIRYKNTLKKMIYKIN